jgi:glycosyltransferase involved in cell wall biosynthesis
MTTLKNLSATFMMSTPPPKTGGEIYDDHLYRHAVSAGWQINYIPVQKLREETRARLARYFGWLPSQALSLLTAVALVRQLSSLRGLVVQDQEYSVALLGTNLLLLLFRRGSILTIVHHIPGYDSTAPESGPKRVSRWKNKVALWPSAQLVTVSEYSKRELISLGLDPARISIISPGVDRAALKIFPKPTPDDQVHIVTLGSVSPRKGTIHLVEAFIKMARTNAQLHIVGSTTLDADYCELVRDVVAKGGSEVASRIHFCGRLEQGAVNQLLSRADILAMPSLQEGFGIALLEGMYFGLPIVTTNITAQPELVQDGVNGLLVPPSDPSSLAKALQRLVDDPELRRTLGQRGQQGLEGRYHWETTCSQFEEQMRRLVSTSS